MVFFFELRNNMAAWLLHRRADEELEPVPYCERVQTPRTHPITILFLFVWRLQPNLLCWYLLKGEIMI